MSDQTRTPGSTAAHPQGFTNNFGQPTHGTEFSAQAKTDMIRAVETYAAKNMTEELSTVLKHRPRRLISVRAGRSAAFTAANIVSPPVQR